MWIPPAVAIVVLHADRGIRIARRVRPWAIVPRGVRGRMGLREPRAEGSTAEAHGQVLARGPVLVRGPTVLARGPVLVRGPTVLARGPVLVRGPTVAHRTPKPAVRVDAVLADAVLCPGGPREATVVVAQAVAAIGPAVVGVAGTSPWWQIRPMRPKRCQRKLQLQCSRSRIRLRRCPPLPTAARASPTPCRSRKTLRSRRRVRWPEPAAGTVAGLGSGFGNWFRIRRSDQRSSFRGAIFGWRPEVRGVSRGSGAVSMGGSSVGSQV